jgi:hypothetical protein
MDPFCIEIVWIGKEEDGSNDSVKARSSHRRTAVSKNTPFIKFDYAIAAEETRSYYHRKINAFLSFIDLKQPTLEEGVNLLYKTIKEEGVEWFSDQVFDFMGVLKGKVSRKEMAAITIRNYYKPIKLFCDMNNILINWKMITRGLPVGRRSAQDRAPTLDEIHKLLEYAHDERVKPLVLLMVSSGIRLGAWAYLKWKHVIPILKNDNNIVIAAKVIVYAGEPDEYFTFCTPEAYFALKDWMDFRFTYGELVTGESWLMRNKWRTANIKYAARVGLASAPQPLKINGIKSLLHHIYFKQGIRPILQKGQNRHEFKTVHGFRKFFKTVCEQSEMKPANVELLIGHDIGISSSYYKPTESQLLEDYLKVVNSLTIDKAFKLQKQLLETKKENDIYRKDLEEYKKLSTEWREEMNEIRRALNTKTSKDL